MLTCTSPLASATSVERRQISRALRASPETAATCNHYHFVNIWKHNWQNWWTIFNKLRWYWELKKGILVGLFFQEACCLANIHWNESTLTGNANLTFLDASCTASGSNAPIPDSLECTISCNCWNVYGWNVILFKPCYNITVKHTSEYRTTGMGEFTVRE